MSAVIDPFARRGDPLAGGNHRRMPDQRDQFAVTARLDPQNTEAIVLIAVGDRSMRPASTSWVDGSGCGFMWTVASSTILLGGASGRSRRSLAEKMAGDIDYRKASSLFCAGFEICLHEDLDGLLAGINFDADRRITEIYLVSATVAPPDDRMRHFCATPVTELPSRRLRDVVSFPKIQLTAREVKKKRDHPMRRHGPSSGLPFCNAGHMRRRRCDVWFCGPKRSYRAAVPLLRSIICH
jgi:hypothetical protein